ncbi:MAG: hypothetical protein M1603_01640 [Candidatus Marsarchaeota archaeon]|jgi:hypothetical protein|nr:hypothetical protein [Candidatus Marsarchaeota archaeon]
MIYSVRINKRVRYIRVYTIVKRIGQNTNPLTKLFMKLLVKKPKES